MGDIRRTESRPRHRLSRIGCCRTFSVHIGIYWIRLLGSWNIVASLFPLSISWKMSIRSKRTTRHMMICLALRLGLAATLLCFSLSQTYSDGDSTIPNLTSWLVPDGSQEELSETYIAGQIINLSWSALNNSREDLWVTSWGEHRYTQLVAEDIDVSYSNTHSWTIDITDSELSRDQRFFLRLYPTNGGRWQAPVEQDFFDSPGFYVLMTYVRASSSSDACAGYTCDSEELTIERANCKVFRCRGREFVIR
ncbi:hypothetical protein K402DRAFT_63020 [Aulographum hederae CBS 113979]|uniref:Uncharacterized protein n=1 Tax=Aulographum hederae CBS 113979 TaxID=1176131 RepID=A0A6G1H206_9PEZI|nr:hypothetical protein K402DRAFT_63020 [Aulographum hederae CBS 113979]